MLLQRLNRPLLILCTALWLAPKAWAAPELIDRIVATVDYQTILWSELNLRVLTELEQVQTFRKSHFSKCDITF